MCTHVGHEQPIHDWAGKVARSADVGLEQAAAALRLCHLCDLGQVLVEGPQRARLPLEVREACMKEHISTLDYMPSDMSTITMVIDHL